MKDMFVKGMNFSRQKQTGLWSLMMVVILMIGGCSQAGQTLSSSPNAEVTRVNANQAASSPAAFSTPAVEVAQVTPVIVQPEFHPNLDKTYYFTYDDALWRVEMENSGPRLVHTELTNCYLVDPEYSDQTSVKGSPDQQVTLGARDWTVTRGNIYTYRDGEVKMELGTIQVHNTSAACKTAQETVLKTLVIEGETVSGETVLVYTETPSPTATPLPEYSCPLAPEPKLKVGDKALTTAVVLLRSSPEKLSTNVIRKIPKNALVLIEEGPVCGEFSGGAYAYWRVTLVRTGEEGWMAESGLGKYYMEYTDPDTE